MSSAQVAKPVIVPQLSMRAQIGKDYYDQTCVACHGADAVGTENGPSFIHPTYNPGHHADEAFYRAVRQGVPAHHWRFGDMPPQPDVTDQQVGAIVNYVRELQRANGILTQEHRM
jgi:mono/diheme cytochrome c family protein